MTHTSIRVEPIDHRHPSWSDVLAAIFRTGDRESVMLRDDGWLSSRQTILAAFDGPSVVGHLCFRVEPTRGSGGSARIQSRIDSFSIDDKYDDQSVHDLLMGRANFLADVMKCQHPQIERTAC
jgi:hypothetical protein